MKKYNYYELEFLIDDDGSGLRRTNSMCVLGYRKPTIEEAKEFWKTDCEMYGDEALVAIYELTEEEAHTDFDMSRESEFPIFGEELSFDINDFRETLREFETTDEDIVELAVRYIQCAIEDGNLIVRR